MARRPSAVSVNSHASASSPLLSAKSPNYLKSPVTPASARPNFKGGPSWPPRSASLAGNVAPPSPFESASIDVDDIFSKNSIAEVRALHLRLRADAEDKQEELRLMVGERYRDLLQASTSIIAIAQSSRQVLGALDETKDTILAQRGAPISRQSQAQDKDDDAHLRSLQVLSAHIKLLLDAPEHLWKLIERGHYFEAAWLFLLARLVYRAVTNDDDQDGEESWADQGVDITEQFPLVQRQWETISQFRTQIVQRATLSLTEHTLSSESVCATLLTLHLLDSRPLSDILSILLEQRTKALHSVLSNALSDPTAIGNGIIAHSNGYAEPSSPATSRSRKATAREVELATQTAFSALTSTIAHVRKLFWDETGASMVRRVVDRLQDDAVSGQPATTTSSELALTTPALLFSLPSSTYLLLLPPSLQSYKPHIAASSLASGSDASVSEKLGNWFQSAIHSLGHTLEQWFADIQDAKEIWKVRSLNRRWLNSVKTLPQPERSNLFSCLDSAVTQRVTDICKASVEEAVSSFRISCTSVVQDLASGTGTNNSSTPFLLQNSGLPDFRQLGPVSNASLKKYKRGLRQRIAGQTPAINETLVPLEKCARTLKGNITPPSDDDADTRQMAERLVTQCRPYADKLCAEVVETLRSQKVSEDRVVAYILIGKLADRLCSHASAMGDMGIELVSSKDFRQDLSELYTETIERWKSAVVSSVIGNYLPQSSSAKSSLHNEDNANAPSPALVASLTELADLLREWGVYDDVQKAEELALGTLVHFIDELLKVLTQKTRQALWDWSFVSCLASSWNKNPQRKRIEQHIGELRNQIDSKSHPSAEEVQECLARTQLLLLPLLPASTEGLPMTSTNKDSKLVKLLPFGTPSLDAHANQPVLDLAPTSSRFGLLLVAGTVSS